MVSSTLFDVTSLRAQYPLGMAIEVVARLLGHRSSTTTSQTYIHLDVADVRQAPQRVGVWSQPEAVL